MNDKFGKNNQNLKPFFLFVTVWFKFSIPFSYCSFKVLLKTSILTQDWDIPLHFYLFQCHIYHHRWNHNPPFPRPPPRLPSSSIIVYRIPPPSQPTQPLTSLNYYFQHHTSLYTPQTSTFSLNASFCRNPDVYPPKWMIVTYVLVHNEISHLGCLCSSL